MKWQFRIGKLGNKGMINYHINKLQKVLLSGVCEQRNLPSGYTQVNSVTNTEKTALDTGVKFDFSKNYEIELRVRGVVGFWYIFQAKETGGYVWGISGSITTQSIRLGFGADEVVSQITRVNGNIYYIKCTINNGNLTLYVKDETAGTEDIATGTYTVTTGQSVNILLFGNLASQYVNINSDVYFARIKEDGNYILNYIPCKQSTTAGFFDKASNTFKTTANLSAGANAVPTPDNPIDIVCNNGVIKVNRNLYSTEYHDSTLSQTDGVTTSTNASTTGINVSAMVNCTNVKSFMVTSAKPKGNYRLFKYRPDGTFINASTAGTMGQVLEIPSDCGYFRIQYNYSIGVETENILIYYDAYNLGIYTDGTQEVVTDNLGNTAIAEMLLAVGDYKDTQEVISGVVKRNVGIKVLDGTENWVLSTAVGTSNLFYCTQTNMDYNSTSAAICTHYTGELPSVEGSNQRDKSIKASYDNYEITHIRLYLRDTSFATLSDLTTFLANQYNAGTPVIIIYPLETATTETVTAQPLAGSSATVTAGSIDNLPIEYK